MSAALHAEVIARAEERAEHDTEFAGALAVLVDAPPGGAGEYERLVARSINERRRTRALEEFRAAAIVTSDVRHLLGLGTPQAVHRLRSRGRLIGLQLGNATWFPGWQFLDGRIRPDLPRILGLLRLFADDTIVADRVMRLVRDDLGRRSIATALNRPKLAPAAWAALAELAG